MANPLKILLVNRALPEHVPGGLERHAEDLAWGLAADGIETHVLAAEASEAIRARYAQAGVTLHGLDGVAPERYTLAWLRRAPGRIRELHTRENFDLIHGQEFALGNWRAQPGDPTVVVTVHGTITSETPLHRTVFPMLSPWGKAWALARFGRRWLYQPAWRRTLGTAQAILVDSAFTREELLRWQSQWENKLRVVGLAVGEDLASPLDRDAARLKLGWQGMHFLTLGRLEWQKGHEHMLRSLAELRERAGKDALAKVHYHIAGAGSYEPTLRTLTRRLKLEANVEFCGRVSEEQKRTMLAGADLFVWPERTHPAFGLVGLEAMLQGTPVLATARGAIPEMLDEGSGWCVPAARRADEAIFTERLQAMLSAPEILINQREGLRERTLARFTLARMIEGTVAAYRQALHESE